ncbi:SCO family protein [Paenibacillus humicus]|uniref:SCO family protein n=1 Tax=Paenibacillus humicus TaxID=412861 RepID=UPI000FD6E341
MACGRSARGTDGRQLASRSRYGASPARGADGGTDARAQLLDVLEIEAGTRDAEFFSFTIDPERDTAEALIKYSEKLEADLSGWDFLRGEEAGNFDILVMKDEGGTLSLVNLRGCYMFHAIVTAHSRRC